MLKLDEVKTIPVGKGIRVQRVKEFYHYNALVVKKADEGLYLMTENGALSKPQYKTYGKTWYVECVN